MIPGSIVVVKLGMAVICFAGNCHPSLIGSDTPLGSFQIHPRDVIAEGYKGQVLEFKEDDKYVWAIHRVWTLNPKEHRQARLDSTNPEDRHITKGCVNVSPEVYEELVDCCSYSKLEIVP